MEKEILRVTNQRASVSVLFVCLGNICRSPTAQGIFQEHVNAEDLGNLIYIDSAGTGDWHIGKKIIQIKKLLVPFCCNKVIMSS